MAVPETPSSSRKLDYDVIVVGGGPAGCTFVRSLITLKSRLRVLLIDKDHFPRDKVCGDGLSYQAIPAVRKVFPELGSLTPSSSFTDQQILCYPQGHRFFRKRQGLDVIPRFEFDNALWQATVKAGAETLENARVTGLLTGEKGVCGVQLQDSNGARKLSCGLVVGADGSRSIVRQATGATDDDYVIHALRQYVRGIPDSTEGSIFFFDIEHWGYFWIFPFVRDGERWANLGYGNATDNRILKDRFWDYFRKPDVQKYLGNARLEGNLTGFPLNLARFRWNGHLTRPLWGPGYLLLGDSAALIHPLYGEGIAFAVDSGAIAAEVLTDDRIPEAHKGVAYERRVLRRVRPLFLSPLAFCAIRLPMLLPRRLGNAIVAAASFAQKVFALRLRTVSSANNDKTDGRRMPTTILLAGFVLSLLLIAPSGFWISHALGLSALPDVYTVRANVFIVIGTAFCLLDATGRYGWLFASTFLFFTLIGSAAVEFVGIETGRIFGTYHYNPAMQAQLFGILPVVVPFGWFIVSYLAFATARALLRENAPPLSRAVLATGLLVAYDLASDPNQVNRGVWTYVHGGAYYGVPPQNFAAWAVLGFIGMLVLGFICRRKATFPENTTILPLPVIAYGAVVLQEGMFGLFIARQPIPAALAFVTTGGVLAASLFRISRQRQPRLS